MGILKIKRVYEEPAPDDGIRILVDRLWPRGVSKAKANIDYWLKTIAPSPELRVWFNHEPEKFKEFSKCYKKELSCNQADIDYIKKLLKNNNVTLIYAAKNPQINHAIVLKTYLDKLQNKT